MVTMITLRSGELSEVSALRQQILNWSVPSIDYDETDSARHYILERNGEVIGGASAGEVPLELECWDELRAVRLWGLAVRPEFRGPATWDELLHIRVNYAKHIGADIVWIRSKDGSWAYYESRGFMSVTDVVEDPTTGIRSKILVRKLYG